MEYKILDTKCVGCGLCAKNCPVSAISKTDKIPAGKPDTFPMRVHAIDPKTCIKCGLCQSNCRFGAIIKD